MSFLEAELRPGLTGRDGGVDLFLDDGCADTTGGFDAFAIVVEEVGGDGFGAVFVCGDGLGGEGGGVVELFVVGPVGPAVSGEVSNGRGAREEEGYTLLA